MIALMPLLNKRDKMAGMRVQITGINTQPLLMIRLRRNTERIMRKKMIFRIRMS